MHQQLFTILVTDLPARCAGAVAAYDARGWPTVERAWAMVAKPNNNGCWPMLYDVGTGEEAERAAPLHPEQVAELLRRHGFVLPDNPADVCELDLSGLCTASAKDEEAHRLESLRSCGLSQRFFLFRGGSLPAGLLPAARILCAAGADELSRALAAVDGGGAAADGEGEEAAAFDWSLVDWSAGSGLV